MVKWNTTACWASLRERDRPHLVCVCVCVRVFQSAQGTTGDPSALFVVPSWLAGQSSLNFISSSRQR